MIVVSGVSRSGTSLMMDCLNCGLGADRVVGLPSADTGEARSEADTPESACWKYLHSLAPPDEDMNPNGFFEDIYAVKGMHYRMYDWKRLQHFLEHPEKVVKIVARGIIHTDPVFVGKVILMVRHPRAVAYSQRRLKRHLPLKEMEDEQVISPDFFIRVAVPMCAWITQHGVPVYVVEYETLIESPLEALRGVFGWLGEGSAEKAATRVDTSLNRSKRAENSLPRWDWAEEIWECLRKKDFATVAKMSLKPLSEWECVRSGLRTGWDRCRLCVTVPNVRRNFRGLAERTGVPWEERPCLYECGFGPGPFVSIEDSIKNNSWS